MSNGEVISICAPAGSIRKNRFHKFWSALGYCIFADVITKKSHVEVVEIAFHVEHHFIRLRTTGVLFSVNCLYFVPTFLLGFWVFLNCPQLSLSPPPSLPLSFIFCKLALCDINSRCVPHFLIRLFTFCNGDFFLSCGIFKNLFLCSQIYQSVLGLCVILGRYYGMNCILFQLICRNPSPRPSEHGRTRRQGLS